MSSQGPAYDPASDVAAVRADESLDVAALHAYLRGRIPGDDRPLEVLQFPGGHSNLTYLLRLGADEYVLRRPPLGPVAPRAHDMVREFRVLAAVGPHFPPAPRVLLVCEDDSVIGVPFFIMERRYGVVIRQGMPAEIEDTPAVRRRIGEAAIDTLADLHAIAIEGTALAALGKPEGFVERQVKGWADRWTRAKTDQVPLMDDLVPWLEARIPPPGPASVVHNDFKLDNMMIDPTDPGRVIAVLDWEMATIGDPLVDLGILLAYWTEASDPPERFSTAMQPTYLEGFPTRAQVVERYRKRSRRDLHHLGFYETFAIFKLAVVLQQIYVRYARGQTQDERFAMFAGQVERLAALAAEARDRSGL